MMMMMRAWEEVTAPPIVGDIDEEEINNNVEEDGVGDIDDDDDDEEGDMGRGDRPSHIVNCVCFLSVKASPEAKTPISQIQSGEEGGDDHVDNDEDDVEDSLLDDGHAAVDDFMGNLISALREEISLVLTYSGLAPMKFDRLTPNSSNPVHYKPDKSAIQFVRASLLIDHTHDTFYFPSRKILHLSPKNLKSTIMREN